MNHHEYQIYYGGRKTKLINFIYCTNCHRVTTKAVHKVILMHLRSHKKRKGKPLSGIKFNLPMRNSAYEKLSD